MLNGTAAPKLLRHAGLARGDRAQKLEALLKDIGDHPLTGPATDPGSRNLGLTQACGGQTTSEGEASVATVRQKLYLLGTKRSNGTVPVCWSSISTSRADFPTLAATVRKRANEEWPTAANDVNQTSRVLESTKKPLENRVWYNHPGQPDPIEDGTSAAATATGRVLSGNYTSGESDARGELDIHGV